MDRNCTARVQRSLPNLDSAAAIAFSGGGDSTALLHVGRNHPQINHAFIIDHALRPGSDVETAEAAEFARSLGYKVQTKRWQHNGVSTAIQVKAREYRYAAMGAMCRDENIKHLITGHTQDDQAETLLMRLDRQTGWRGLAGMADAAYAPLWPALAGVTLHRPWLGVSRADIRTYNALHKLKFIDDPSNENRDFTRVRARQALAADKLLRADLLEQQVTARTRLTAERQTHAAWLMEHAIIHPQGFIETNAVPPSELLLHILNGVSGQGGPIDSAKRVRLCTDMRSAEFKAATLSGAWVLRKEGVAGHNYVFLRDRVAVKGRSGVSRQPRIVLEKQAVVLWDGRFFCKAKTDGMRIEPALGHLQKLRQISEFNTLFDLPSEVRPTLPVFFHEDRPVGYGACETEFVSTRACSASRLQALFPN